MVRFLAWAFLFTSLGFTIGRNYPWPKDTATKRTLFLIEANMCIDEMFSNPDYFMMKYRPSIGTFPEPLATYIKDELHCCLGVDMEGCYK